MLSKSGFSTCVGNNVTCLMWLCVPPILYLSAPSCVRLRFLFLFFTFVVQQVRVGPLGMACQGLAFLLQLAFNAAHLVLESLEVVCFYARVCVFVCRLCHVNTQQHKTFTSQSAMGSRKEEVEVPVLVAYDARGVPLPMLLSIPVETLLPTFAPPPLPLRSYRARMVLGLCSFSVRGREGGSEGYLVTPTHVHPHARCS